ncbi:TRAP transporter substrate-binding protein [Clostridia bacterium OttesenSCG-928-O13]|nr:TRAP transporter substrate-binding protein [Clostridia bacterium OttesenSCG-928-O13]
MRKMFAFVLALSMVLMLSLTGCKKTADTPAPTGGTTASTSTDGSTAGGDGGYDGPVITIKMTTVQLDSQQMGIAAQQLQKLVDERLAGKVELLSYPGGQLYANTEELEALKTGDIQMCLAVGSTMSTLDPAIGIFKMPFLFPTVDAAYSVMDGPTGEKLFANIKDQGINVLGGFSSGSIIISNSKHPIQDPADFSGLKIRASGKMESAIIDAMGGISTVIPSEETYTGLQQKVVDGLATPSTVFYARKYQEVQTYVTNAGMLYWSNGFILANDKFWQDLPADIRDELTAIVEEVLATTRDADENELQDMLDKVEAEGCEVVRELTMDQVEAWREATKSVYTQYEAEIGKELIEEVQKAVDEYMAANG